MTPGAAAAALAGVDVEQVLAATLEVEAEQLASAVRALLGEAPAGAHDHPWRQSGALQESVTARSDGLTASVSSDDPAAAPQEFGTAHVPPRPFLAPAAAVAAEPMARALGQALATAIRQRLG